jgi:pectate lyase
MNTRQTSALAAGLAFTVLGLGSGACSGDSHDPGDATGGKAGSAGASAGKGSSGTAGSNGGVGGSKAGAAGNGGSPSTAGTSAGGKAGSAAMGGASGTAGTPNAGSGGAAGLDAGGSSGSGSLAGAGGALGGAGQGGGGSTAGTGTAGKSGGGSSGSGTSGASGSGGKAGSGGAGPGDCPTALVGWATVSGDNVSATTGGGNATPVRPANVNELLEYAGDGTARVIEIEGSFAVPSLEIASNKTLVGIGNDATINGGIRVRGYEDEPITNVILRNLSVNGKTTADEDAIQIYFAHHVWLDHLDVWDGPDGNLDLTHAVNWVTVSWSRFRYTSAYVRPEGESSDHRFSSLVGHSDNNAEEDDGRLKVTFHHNWWAEGVIERMPRVRFGQVHVFNNFFSSQDSNYCVRAGRSAQLLIEGNYFDRVNSPHEFNNEEDEATASITARNNVYNQTTGEQRTGGGGPTFTSAPYAPTIEPAEGIPAIVQACAGPR